MSEQTLTVQDYTDAYFVPRSLKKIGKIYIPWRGGILWDDAKRFGIGLVAWTFILILFLLPMINAIGKATVGGTLRGLPFFMVWLLPAFAFAIGSRRPMRHGLYALGALYFLWLRILDDPIHRYGVPQKHRPFKGSIKYSADVWTPSAEYLPNLVRDKTYLPVIAVDAATMPEQPVYALHTTPTPAPTPDNIRRRDENADDTITLDHIHTLEAH